MKLKQSDIKLLLYCTHSFISDHITFDNYCYLLPLYKKKGQNKNELMQ